MSNIKELIIEHYSGHVDEAPLFADGFDDAIIGICPTSFRVIYSRNKCINKMIAEGETWEDAVDYLEYNTFNAYVGEYTPVWAEDFEWNEEPTQ
tara:strand:- start:6046 stop:6327 length:282 start_codon:yes stop_codon:yes gene_type:complete